MKTKFTIVGRKIQNSNSGNHCMDLTQLTRGYDFKFIFEDDVNVIIEYNELISYVQGHPEVYHTGLVVTDKNDNNRWLPIQYVLIPDEYILTYIK